MRCTQGSVLGSGNVFWKGHIFQRLIRKRGRLVEAEIKGILDITNMTKYMLFLSTMEDYFPWRQHFMDDTTMTIIWLNRRKNLSIILIIENIKFAQNIFAYRGQLEKTSFNIALIKKCISNYTVRPVFAIGSIWQNIFPREFAVKLGLNSRYMVKYSPSLLVVPSGTP